MGEGGKPLKSLGADAVCRCTAFGSFDAAGFQGWVPSEEEVQAPLHKETNRYNQDDHNCS